MRQLLLTFLLVLSFSLWAQESLILQRVNVEEPKIENPDQVNPVFLQSAQTLFDLINTRQPVIRASADEANSSIETSIRPAADGTEIRFTLIRGGESLVTSAAVISTHDTYTRYQAFLERSADEFAPFLDKVPPEVRITELKTDPKTRKLLDELLFNKSLATPFETTLWMGILSKNPGESSSGPVYLHFPFHYFGEFTWYMSPNNGITGSLFLEYSDYASPGDSVANPDDPGLSDNLYILPGIGYTYRTLGRLSAGFYTGLNVGGLRITAREDLTWNGGLNLQNGESEWVLFHFFVMRPFISYAFNESWSIKTSFALYITLFQLIPGPWQTDYYNAGDPGAEIQFLNLGLSYRW